MFLPFDKLDDLTYKSTNIQLSRNKKYTSNTMPLEISEGIRNFEIYNKYNYYYWPYWINRYNDLSHERIQSLPFFLYNNHCRTWYTINSFLNSGGIRIDPSGMVHPVWANWSIEFWIYENETILQLHNDTCIHQENNDGIIKTNVKYPTFNFTQLIYLTHTNIDEAIVIGNIHHKKNNKIYCMIVIRPYTTEKISGLHSIELLKNNIIRINDHYHVALLLKPDFVLTGNEILGDINFKRKDNKHIVSSKAGMATMAFVYDVSRTEIETGVRIAVNKDSKISLLKFSARSSKAEYSSYIDLRMKEGVGITIAKQELNEWVNFCKFSSLVEASNIELNEQQNTQNYNHYYFTIIALNRMGYSQQSLFMIDSILKRITVAEDFSTITNIACMCNIIADYYRVFRDSSFLQKYYHECKNYAQNILQFCKEMQHIRQYINKSDSDTNENSLLSIPNIISALENVAFMSRSLGLFGDEKKFLSIVTNLKNSFINTLFNKSQGDNSADEKFIEWLPKYGKPLRKQKILVKESLGFSDYVNVNDNRIIQYISFLYPYMADIVNTYNIENILDSIIKAGKGVPLYNTIIGGIDVVHSLCLANTMLYAHDKRGVEIIYAIIALCKKRKFMPDFLDPVSGHAIVKNPISAIAVSLLFQSIRNMCFLDHPERLELFPIPVDEWFGDSHIVITHAPSRFGNISFTTTTTSNEIVIQFNTIPRFIPHDILINLPCKAKIKMSDDFIVKYETEKSWCINGWPSEIRFKR